MAKHWTQTRAGKKRQSELQKARWARIHNGASPSSAKNEFETMQQILKLWISLSEPEQNYIRQRLA